jgi:hypothetical protein
MYIICTNVLQAVIPVRLRAVYVLRLPGEVIYLLELSLCVMGRRGNSEFHLYFHPVSLSIEHLPE